jgi:tRNA (cytidine/uridine-2'-O-)-methyltransferase
MHDLRGNLFEVALVHPQIAPNTGNIARTCVATGTPLHLVRPMGFVLDDRQLKRSAMDYWPRLNLTVHADLESFQRAMIGRRLWLFDSAGATSLWNAQFLVGDVLVFGSETAGLPANWLNAVGERAVRIPQLAAERCLNLSTACGITIYEAMRQASMSKI